MPNRFAQVFQTKYLIWPIALILLCLALYFGLFKVGGGKEDLWRVDLSGLKADLVLKGVQYTRAEKGRVKWVVNAGTARLFEDKEILELEQVVIDFFNSRGKKVIVKADTGVYDLSKEDMFLKGNVEVVSEKGDTLFTDSMFYSHDRDLIHSDEKVFIKGGGLEIQGKGFEYDLKQGKFVVKDQSALIKEGSEIEL